MAIEPEPAQRRKDKRIKQWNRAAVRVLGAGPGLGGLSGAEAFTYDLSLGGTRIHSQEPLEVGTRISLRIELLRSSESLSIDGLVRWARPSEADGIYEMGIEFDHSSSQTIMSLMRNLHDARR